MSKVKDYEQYAKTPKFDKLENLKQKLSQQNRVSIKRSCLL